MRIRSLVGALALSAALPLALPSEAQAAHRHSRSCGHRYSSYDSYRDYGYRDYGYRDHRYRDRGYSNYGYRGYSRGYSYRPYYRSRYYYAPPPGYYYRAPRYYRRPHFSIHLDF
jgi:hypothetical protein